jgi:thymidylate kinase
VGRALEMSGQPSPGSYSMGLPPSLGRPLLCELVGLPGSGKTTAAAHIVQAMRSEGWSCGDRSSLRSGSRSRALSRVRRIEFHLRNPSHLAAALRFGSSVRPMNIASLTRAYRVSNWAYGISPAQTRGWDRIVLDQGVLQELWSVTISGTRWSAAALDAILRTVLRDADISLALVYLDVSPEVAFERLRRRAPTSSRFDHMAPIEARALLSRHADDLRELFEHTVRLTGVPSLRVNGERVLDRIRADVTAFVDGLQTASRPAHQSGFR